MLLVRPNLQPDCLKDMHYAGRKPKANTSYPIMSIGGMRLLFMLVDAVPILVAGSPVQKAKWCPHGGFGGG